MCTGMHIHVCIQIHTRICIKDKPLMGPGYPFITASPSLKYGSWVSTQGTKRHKLGASWTEANVGNSGL